MAKPETYPDWATESDNVTTPPEARVRIGWEQYDRPTSSVFNWWKNLAGRWIRHLDEVVSEHTEALSALTNWRGGIDNRTLRARYSFPRQALSALDMVRENLYRLPIGNSSINVDQAQMWTTNPAVYRFFLDFPADLDLDDGLTVFSQADTGSHVDPYVTSSHFKPDRIVDGAPLTASLEIIATFYYPGRDSPSSSEIVPGLSVVVF